MAEQPPIVTPLLGQVDPDKSTVQGQMTGLLDQDSDYMKLAATGAKQQANKAGLLNSTMAASAGQAAAINAAMPIAQADAKSYFNQDLANQQVQNQFKQGEQNFGFNQGMANLNQENQVKTLNKQSELQSGLDAQKYLAEQDRDRLASQLDLVGAQSQHQQDIEKAYLQSIANLRQTASSDAALIGRTEGLTAEQQTTAMNKVYDQANLDIQFMESVFSQPQSWNW